MSKKSHRHHSHRDERRQQFVSVRKVRRGVSGTWLVIGAGIGFLALTLYLTLANTGGVSAGTLVEAETLPSGRDARLPLTLFADGRARFYQYTTSIGREIRFFVVQSSDGVVRAAFDACDVCYRERKGYHQAGDMMICNNCGRSFRSVDVNVITGGCNPSPLQRTIDGDALVLKTADLDLGAVYF